MFSLLPDQERADAFIEDHIENVTNNGNDDDIENVTSNENDDTQLANVWYTKSRPTVKCMTATSKLLELRLRLKDNFNDKKTHKETLWQQIVKEMREAGFNVDAKKCKQKFANLQKTYIKCKDHRRKTGTERINNPPFYFELDAILGEKHKCHPQNLQVKCTTLEKLLNILVYVMVFCRTLKVKTPVLAFMTIPHQVQAVLPWQALIVK